MDFRGKSKAPVLSVAGWYDLFLNTQIADFQALVSKDDPDSRLIIGPLAHGSPGEPNEYGGLKKTGKPAAIFKYLRKAIKRRKAALPSPLHDKRYNLFVMERNEYIGSDVWPPAETEIRKYYLGPEDVIASEPFEMSGSLSYTYDPADPFPSLGGTTLGKGVGPARQNPNVGRKDQIAFEMDAANAPLILLGPVSATLWLSSSAECTDFIVSIQDVFPDGKIINIQEGGARLKFADDSKKQAEISVWATGYQLNPGHRLRVVISSGWFPRYNRSLNNCEPAAIATTMNKAVQTLWYGPDTPSSVNLPVYTIPSGNN